jgi:hypothetical protein
MYCTIVDDGFRINSSFVQFQRKRNMVVHHMVTRSYTQLPRCVYDEYKVAIQYGVDSTICIWRS